VSIYIAHRRRKTSNAQVWVDVLCILCFIFQFVSYVWLMCDVFDALWFNL